MRTIRKTTLWLITALCLATAGTAAAQSTGDLLPSLFWDRVDQNAVWRLSDHVPTADGTTPAEARPLYIQFGFIGCAPCVELAMYANEELPDNVVKVYVHLDDVLLQQGYNNQRLWTELHEHSTEPPYAGYVPIRRGSTNLMRQLCGETADAPSALLVLPTGAVSEIIHSSDEEQARAAFQRFASALAATN